MSESPPETSTPPPALARSTASLWRNVSFMLMWSSVAASGFGDRLIQLGAWELMGIAIEGRSAASIQAAVSFFFFLPYILFGPAGGWIADTLPRKWVMFFCDETRGIILLIAALSVPAALAAGDPKLAVPDDAVWFTLGSVVVPRVVQAYVMIFLVGTLAAIFSPTKQATVPQIVPIQQLQAANAIILGIATIASMIGLGVGGWMMKEWSVRTGLMAAMLAFTVSGTFFIFLRPRPHVVAKDIEGSRPSELKRLIEAAGYIRRHKPIVGLIFVSLLFWSAAHVFIAAIAALCKLRYGFASEDVTARIAIMQMTVGLGMLVSALWVAWIGSRRESDWVALGSLLLAGICMFAMAINPWYSLGLALSFMAGFFGNTAMICVATLTQSITPNYIRGRVFGVRDLVILFVSVVVNLIIWRMPDADKTMMVSLIPLGLVLALLPAYGMWRQLTRGPMKTRFLNILWRLCRAYTLAWHKLRWVDRHHVPLDGGPIIIAANHTTAIDPMLIQASVPQLIRFIMTTPYRIKLMNPIWNAIEVIALEPDGANMTNMREMLRVLKAGHMLGIFPEGRLQRDRRELNEFQPGLGMIARRSGARIVPVWIAGTPLTKSMVRHFIRPSHSMVIFGEPYKPADGMTDEQIVDDLRRRLLELAKRAEV